MYLTLAIGDDILEKRVREECVTRRAGALVSPKMTPLLKYDMKLCVAAASLLAVRRSVCGK